MLDEHEIDHLENDANGALIELKKEVKKQMP